MTVLADGTMVLFKRPCSACAGLKGELLYRQRFATEDSGHFLQGYDVVACSTCGFAFADGVPEQAWFDAYYEQLSKYENTASGGVESTWDTERLRAVSQTIIPHVPNLSAQIVDIGCATGLLLALLRDAGYEHVLGIDPSATCGQSAMARFGIQIRTGTFSTLDLPAGFADVLILSGVVEHLRDIDQALDKMVFLTKTDGLVFVSVPDASRYMDGEDAPFQEFSMEHINFFGPGSLSNIMGTRGFVPVAIIPELLAVNFRTTTPVIHGVFRRAANPPSTSVVAVKKDNATVCGLRAYIARCKQEEIRIDNEIARLVQLNTPLLVWGVGTHTLRLLAQSELGKAHILAFIDGNPRYHGCRLSGRDVCNPDVLRRYPDVPVLISSRAHQEDIAAEIGQTMGCKNAIIRLYSLPHS